MKVTVTVTFLRSKRLGDNSLLLHFGCFSRGVKNFFSLITKHYLLFFWSNNDLSTRCVYVVVNFLSQVIFVFLLFLGMVMYANEIETKEK